MNTTTHAKTFRARPLQKKKEPHALHYLSQKTTFWIAVLSLFAFVTGNMVGQHGWVVFWKSVLGGVDDSLVVYEGTVPPIARVPDYGKWALYGGNAQVHTYQQVPQDALLPMPSYDAARQQSDPDQTVYSIGYMGSYETGREGDGVHPGVDIRVPVGTPVQAIMNGLVSRVGEEPGGFGKFVVLRHPNVPDPAKPAKVTTLYSAYAHLSEISVSEGQIVSMGQAIARSGQTGFATGPHLHFQMDRDVGTDGEKVAYHPYWPFTTAEAREAGMDFTEAINAGLNQDRGYRYTVNPMTYVQARYAPVLVAQKSFSSRVRVSAAELRAQRVQARLARVATRLAVATTTAPAASSSSPATAQQPVVSNTEVLAVADTVPPPAVPAAAVPQQQAKGFVTMEILSARSFSGRAWETVKIRLLDADGRPIQNPKLEKDLYLRTAYGKAEFRPPMLTELDFVNGEAVVQMLPLGKQTVVVQVQPGSILGQPMKYTGD